jgi:hypothetical protein
MRSLLSAGVCLFSLYVIDAYFCDGVYVDAVWSMAAHLRQYF